MKLLAPLAPLSLNHHHRSSSVSSEMTTSTASAASASSGDIPIALQYGHQPLLEAHLVPQNTLAQLKQAVRTAFALDDGICDMARMV